MNARPSNLTSCQGHRRWLEAKHTPREGTQWHLALPAYLSPPACNRRALICYGRTQARHIRVVRAASTRGGQVSASLRNNPPPPSNKDANCSHLPRPERSGTLKRHAPRRDTNPITNVITRKPKLSSVDLCDTPTCALYVRVHFHSPPQGTYTATSPRYAIHLLSPTSLNANQEHPPGDYRQDTQRNTSALEGILSGASQRCK